MKKFIIVVLLIVIGFQVSSTGVFAKEKEQPKYKPEIDAPEPKIPHEDMDIRTEGSVYSVLSCPSEDQYEENDSFESATKLPSNTSIFATISDVPWYCSGGNDLVDYYYITTTRDRTLTISLSSLPTDYDLKLIDEDGNFIRGSYNTGTSNDMITKIVGPGTYYIKVYTTSSDKYHNYDNYRLAINDTEIELLDLEITQEIRENNVGAMWTSRYFPKDINPSIYNGDPIFSFTSTNPSPFRLRMLEEVGLLDSYVSRELYLWDKETKDELYSTLIKLIIEFEKHDLDKNNDLVLFDALLDPGSQVLGSLTVVFSGSTFTLSSLALGAIAFVLPGNNVQVDSILFHSYMNRLASKLHDSDDTEIIKITEMFNVYREVKDQYYYQIHEYYVKLETVLYYPHEMVVYSNHLYAELSGNPFYGELSLIQHKDDLPSLIDSD